MCFTKLYKTLVGWRPWLYSILQQKHSSSTTHGACPFISRHVIWIMHWPKRYSQGRLRLEVRLTTIWGSSHLLQILHQGSACLLSVEFYSTETGSTQISKGTTKVTNHSPTPQNWVQVPIHDWRIQHENSAGFAGLSSLSSGQRFSFQKSLCTSLLLQPSKRRRKQGVPRSDSEWCFFQVHVLHVLSPMHWAWGSKLKSLGSLANRLNTGVSSKQFSNKENLMKSVHSVLLRLQTIGKD